jgi:hypothetical protein
MKNILAYTLAYLFAAGIMTLLVGVIVFCLFWAAIGLIAFVTWSLPVVVTPFWLVVRLSLALGVVASFFFLFSKEGKDFADGFVEDLYKL